MLVYKGCISSSGNGIKMIKRGLKSCNVKKKLSKQFRKGDADPSVLFLDFDFEVSFWCSMAFVFSKRHRLCKHSFLSRLIFKHLAAAIFMTYQQRILFLSCMEMTVQLVAFETNTLFSPFYDTFPSVQNSLILSSITSVNFSSCCLLLVKNTSSDLRNIFSLVDYLAVLVSKPSVLGSSGQPNLWHKTPATRLSNWKLLKWNLYDSKLLVANAITLQWNYRYCWSTADSLCLKLCCIGCLCIYLSSFWMFHPVFCEFWVVFWQHDLSYSGQLGAAYFFGLPVSKELVCIHCCCWLQKRTTLDFIPGGTDSVRVNIRVASVIEHTQLTCTDTLALPRFPSVATVDFHWQGQKYCRFQMPHCPSLLKGHSTRMPAPVKF